jgi:acetyl/propionyl-CoA carboxylase alpha subunit
MENTLTKNDLTASAADAAAAVAANTATDATTANASAPAEKEKVEYRKFFKLEAGVNRKIVFQARKEQDLIDAANYVHKIVTYFDGKPQYNTVKCNKVRQDGRVVEDHACPLCDEAARLSKEEGTKKAGNMMSAKMRGALHVVDVETGEKFF